MHIYPLHPPAPSSFTTMLVCTVVSSSCIALWPSYRYHTGIQRITNVFNIIITPSSAFCYGAPPIPTNKCWSLFDDFECTPQLTGHFAKVNMWAACSVKQKEAQCSFLHAAAFVQLQFHARAEWKLSKRLLYRGGKKESRWVRDWWARHSPVTPSDDAVSLRFSSSCRCSLLLVETNLHSSLTSRRSSWTNTPIQKVFF